MEGRAYGGMIEISKKCLFLKNVLIFLGGGKKHNVAEAVAQLCVSTWQKPVSKAFVWGLFFIFLGNMVLITLSCYLRKKVILSQRFVVTSSLDLRGTRKLE